MFPDADPTALIAAPVLRLPLSIVAERFATLEHDSAEEIAQSVALLLDTQPRDRRTVPGYGLRDLRGHLIPDIDEADVAAALATWEPRADPAPIARSTVPIEGLVQFTVTPNYEEVRAR